MAQVQKLPPRMTPVEYLAGEEVADTRHEFVDGFVYAMSGTTEAHGDIVINLTKWIGARLPAGCRLYNGGVKLRTKPSDDTSFYYPDVFVTCGPRDLKSHMRTDAPLVIEVLSPTTERTDRGEKFAAYTAMPSVTEYMLVAQDGIRVELFRRRTGWSRETFNATDSIALASIGQTLPIAEIYHDIPL